MVTIELYRNYSEPLKVNKELEWVATLNGTFRSGTSITNPIVEIESSEYIDIDFDIVGSDNNEVVTSSGDELSIVTDSNKIININYIYIKEFNRYYYVNNVICISNKLYHFICEIDHLYTYKDKYLYLDALVERNEFNYDDALEDSKMPYEFYQDVNEYNVTDTSEINFKSNVADGCFAISFINDSKYHIHTNVSSPVSCLPSVKEADVGSHIFNIYGLMDGFDVIELASELYDDESQLSFITSLVSYPFEIPHTNYYSTDIRLGDETYQDRKVYYLQNGQNTISPYYKVASINFNNYFTGTYMDYEPYSKYELYLPFYDYVELKSADIRNSVVDIYYSFDYTNGLGRVNIVNTTKNYVIKSIEFNVGCKIAVNRNNLQQLNDERTQMAIKGALLGAGAGAGIIGGFLTGNLLMTAGAIAGLAGGVIDLGSKFAMQHEKATGSNNGGANGSYSCREVRLKITRYVKHEPDDYAHYYGKPLNATIKLNELSGYTLIKDIHLDDLDITKNEIDALYSLLTNGIII